MSYGFDCMLALARSVLIVKQTWCLTSTETIRLIRDGEMGDKGVWRWDEK